METPEQISLESIQKQEKDITESENIRIPEEEPTEKTEQETDAIPFYKSSAQRKSLVNKYTEQLENITRSSSDPFSSSTTL